MKENLEKPLPAYVKEVYKFNLSNYSDLEKDINAQKISIPHIVIVRYEADVIKKLGY